MAAGVVNQRVLGEQDVRSLLAGASQSGRHVLPSLLLTGGEEDWRAITFLLRARSGGFSIVAPSDEGVLAALNGIVDETGAVSVVLCEREALLWGTGPSCWPTCLGLPWGPSEGPVAFA